MAVFFGPSDGASNALDEHHDLPPADSFHAHDYVRCVLHVSAFLPSTRR
jgi:hypothetical protein